MPSVPASSSETAAPAWRVVGTRPVRPDGVDKVTGRALYGADLSLPGMLTGRVLRSPLAHARIKKIDTSAARALPGVRAVVTSADLPRAADRIEDLGEGAINLRYLSDNLLAGEKVLYHGHAIAAVAATSASIAEQALALIRVDYEPLAPVMTVTEALKPDAPLLLADLHTDRMGQRDAAPSNVASHLRHERGKLEEGFRKAALIIDRRFRTETVHQGYIEPQAATAQVQADGQVTIWSSTQGIFAVRSQVAEVLGLPVSQIKVVPTEIGGGFGGKISVYLEPLAVLLSRHAGFLPVRLVMSRTEVLTSTGPTSGSDIRIRIGADAEGRLTAMQAELYYEAGAYPGSPVGAAAVVSFAPYACDTMRVDGYDVVVNRPRASAYRAPGGTNVAFAVESVIDELAESLDLDPIEMRLINAVREGDRRPDNLPLSKIGYVECLQALRQSDHYRTPLTGRHRGRGVACGYWGNWGGQSSATAVLNSDGSVGFNVASTDIGGSRASLAMQLAESLGIDYSQVKPRIGDTDSVSYNDVTGGSRTTFATGWAAYELGQKLSAELRQRLALLWEVPVDTVTRQGDGFAAGEKRVGFAEAARLACEDAPLMVSTTVHPKGYGAAFSVQCADVEVDPDTGKVTVLRYTIVQDAGKAVHPSYVEGQMQGGVAQGIGWALNEEYVYNEKGELLNGSLLDYRMPTACDLPMIDTVIVEVPNPGHPYGVRGVGEVNIIPPAGTLANAIHRATGVRLTALPMSPPRVLAALWDKSGYSPFA
ncbi:MAG: xanthine dehydrogenase family protein molybdopterin-binding subunit [Opitutaceae bacterium]|nr:xanthine dehydrogenase family protein molybdopterin-binding subunit [Opitutaceae bacterium]